MHEFETARIPLSVIAKGRDLEEVLPMYIDFYEEAAKIAAQVSNSEEDHFANTMMGAVYRVYLLGVQDGMNAGKKG